MHFKTCFLLCFTVIFGIFELPGIELNEEERYVNALASMTYFLDSTQEKYSSGAADCIHFSDESVECLWDRICEFCPDQCSALIAHQNYIRSRKLLEEGDLDGACEALSKSFLIVDQLWGASINDRAETLVPECLAARPTADYSPYPHLTTDMKQRFAHFLISEDHPMKERLDNLFSKKRVTANHTTFSDAGFKIVSERPRSYVIVASHKTLPGHLIKCYVDTEKREKWRKPSWHWIEQRCIGARTIRQIIQEKNIKYFDVAKKWIYILPMLHSHTPYPDYYTRHPIILLVTNMNLVAKKDNLYAWQNIMDEKRLDELYYLISRAKGASYRADNIAYSRSKKFCFIDTEYPGRGPEYYRIGRELSSRMAEYWNYLVTHGGS